MEIHIKMQKVKFVTAGSFLFLFLTGSFNCTGTGPQKDEEKVLNKTLVLSKMDSVRYTSNETSAEIFIRLNTVNRDEGKIFGFGGCNNIHGTFITSLDGIPKFKLEMTDKACDKSEIERNLVLLILNLSKIEYTDTPGKPKIAHFYSAKYDRHAEFLVRY